MTQQFYERAAKLGHSAELLQKGMAIRSKSLCRMSINCATCSIPA